MLNLVRWYVVYFHDFLTLFITSILVFLRCFLLILLLLNIWRFLLLLITSTLWVAKIRSKRGRKNEKIYAQEIYLCFFFVCYCFVFRVVIVFICFDTSISGRIFIFASLICIESYGVVAVNFIEENVVWWVNFLPSFLHYVSDFVILEKFFRCCVV